MLYISLVGASQRGICTLVPYTFSWVSTTPRADLGSMLAVPMGSRCKLYKESRNFRYWRDILRYSVPTWLWTRDSHSAVVAFAGTTSSPGLTSRSITSRNKDDCVTLLMYRAPLARWKPSAAWDRYIGSIEG